MNFNFGRDITEQYLVKIYDDLQQEQLRLMNGIKTDVDCNPKQHTAITKQITCINSINLNILKLNNIRKKLGDSC